MAGLFDDEEEVSVANEDGNEDPFGLLSAYDTPSAYADLAPGADRSTLISSLQSDLSGADDMIKRGKKLAIYGDDDLPKSGGSLAAAGILGLLPIALGAAFAGKGGALQGAAMGAEAGVAGATPLLNKMEKDEQQSKLVGADLYKTGAARRANDEKQIAQLKRDEYQQKALDDRARETRDNRPKKTPVFATPEDFEKYKADDILSLQKMGVPADSVAPLKNISDAEAFMKATGEVRRRMEMQNQGTRTSQAGAKIDMLKGAQDFQGYRQLPTARTLSTTEQNSLSVAQQGTLQAIDNLNQQAELVAKNGTLDITGVDAAIEKALSGQYFNINRLRTGSGANFTEMEKELINAISVATAAGGSPVEAVKNLALSRDAPLVFDGLKKLLQRDLDIRFASVGRVRPGADYSDAILEPLGITREDIASLSAPEKTNSNTPPDIDSLRAKLEERRNLKKKDNSLGSAIESQESGGNPNAVSSAGAQGLRQVMPETGAEVAKKLGVSYDPFNPEQNRLIGDTYFQEQLDRFNGDEKLALAAYHSGPGRISKLLRLHNANSFEEIQPFLGPVGRKYPKQVLARRDNLEKLSRV